MWQTSSALYGCPSRCAEGWYSNSLVERCTSKAEFDVCQGTILPACWSVAGSRTHLTVNVSAEHESWTKRPRGMDRTHQRSCILTQCEQMILLLRKPPCSSISQYRLHPQATTSLLRRIACLAAHSSDISFSALPFSETLQSCLKKLEAKHDQQSRTLFHGQAFVRRHCGGEL